MWCGSRAELRLVLALSNEALHAGANAIPVAGSSARLVRALKMSFLGLRAFGLWTFAARRSAILHRMRLVPATLDPPTGLEAFLEELGGGENGFAGVQVQSLSAYLRRLVDYGRGRNVDPGHVPMTTYWLLDSGGEVVGMSRLRHRLTPALLDDGGHIGYYVRPSARGRGHGRELLRLTLVEARRLGIRRALLTVDSGNAPSLRVIEGNGGVMEDERIDGEGIAYRRYWIDLA